VKPAAGSAGRAQAPPRERVPATSRATPRNTPTAPSGRVLAWQLLLMLVLPAAVALALLGLLEVWRAAQAFAAAGGAPLWRWATQAGVAVVGLLWLAVLVLATLPQAAERLQWAQGNDATGRVQLLPAANGRRLRLEGSIGLGDGERVVARLAAMPQLQLLELQGSGTRLGEARRMARAVRERGLQTRMVGPCENACVLVFLAGGGRQMMAGAQTSPECNDPPWPIKPACGAFAWPARNCC